MIRKQMVAAPREHEQRTASVFTWCRCPESNQDAFRQGILSPPCLPFHHSGLSAIIARNTQLYVLSYDPTLARILLPLSHDPRRIHILRLRTTA